MADVPPPEAEELVLAEDTDGTRTRRVVTTRGVVIVSARVFAGLIGLGVAAATVAAASLVPLPVIQSDPSSQLITPVPTAQQLVCPGAMLRLADDTGQGASTASPLGPPTLVSDASEGAVDRLRLPVSDAGGGGTATAPTVISIPPIDPGDAGPALLSGAQQQTVQLGDFVGLAAADCRGVTGDGWLVGGSTAVGRTTLLTLTNPTEVPAIVDLELFGERGEITAPGTRGIVVAAGGQRVIALAGFQPGVASPVVHVSSSGGQVVAHLQQSTVRVVEPGGIDMVGTTTPSALVSVLPGLRLTDAAAVGQLLSAGPDHMDTRTAVRLFAPGEGDVNATIDVIPDDPAVETESMEFEFDAGKATDVLLEELATGTYTVRVTTDVPTVAALRVTTAVEGASDFAWIAAAPELAGRTQLTIADAIAPVLHLANPGGTDLDVELDDEVVTVPAGGSVSVGVDALRTYVLVASGPLHAAVTYAGDGVIAGYPVQPPGRGSTPVVVF